MNSFFVFVTHKLQSTFLKFIRHTEQTQTLPTAIWEQMYHLIIV